MLRGENFLPTLRNTDKNLGSMSLSQSKIPFNIRKKRNSSKSLELETESKRISSEIEKLNGLEDGVICDSDEENAVDSSSASTPSRRSKRKSSMKNMCNVSPVRNEEVSSPKRGRRSHRKISSETSTPSGMMTRLNLDTNSSKENKKSSKFRAARIALGSGLGCSLQDEITSPLIGREEQFQKLLSNLHSCIDEERNISMYVSGPPGTGKTASLGRIMEDSKVKSCYKCIFLNCTSMRVASSIYSHVAKILKPKAVAKGEKEWQLKMEELVTDTKKKILLILDEMDQLLMGGSRLVTQDVLYTVFGWPHIPGSQISLIGVANALDLTSRALPRLHASNPPILVHFPPYTRDEIHKILLHRLSMAGVGGVFSAPALQMLASKVASVSGDVRRALDVGRRVVQLVGDRGSSEKKSLAPEDFGVLQPSSDHCSNSPKKSNSMVELQEVLSVLNGVYSTSQSLISMNSKTASRGSDLPMQQKFLLCSLILLVKKGPKGKPITIGRLHEVYSRACKGRNITPVDQSEFFSLCTLVETRGIIRIISNKEARLSKISLQWDEEEVAAALMDQHLLASILADVSCLSRS